MTIPAQTSDDGNPPIPGLIGSGPAMQKVYRLTRQVARSQASVLLLGETGTGKELIAKAIHQLSPRGSGPFVRVNCGALSESLLESELFGHVRGSFTGAIANRTGRFEAAHTGTIFLDEINSTTPKLQVKLLRVLQEREFERVGDTQTIRVDTRVIAASNRDLLAEIESERFREDLFYRLNVVPIQLPPLRDRPEDIPELVGFFLNIYNEENDRYVAHIHPQAVAALQAYHWPGNVRELQNYVERSVVMAAGDELTVDLLPDALISGSKPRSGRSRPADLETLTYELVQQGLATASATGRQLARQDRQPRRTRIDCPGHGLVRKRADQSRQPPGHQPQHAAQEAERIRARRRRVAGGGVGHPFRAGRGNGRQPVRQAACECAARRSGGPFPRRGTTAIGGAHRRHGRRNGLPAGRALRRNRPAASCRSRPRAVPARKCSTAGVAGNPVCSTRPNRRSASHARQANRLGGTSVPAMPNCCT